MKVSVIVPNYNHAKYLKQRIDSILNQTFKDFELIILDDCSTDSSRKIIDEYLSRFPFIFKYYNTSNSGSPFIQWDFGINKAKGEFIWIAESDDFAEPEFLEKTTTILQENEKVGLVCCNSKVVDEKTQREYLSSEWNIKLNCSKWSRDYINAGKDELSEYLYLNCTIHNISGVLFRKSKYLECGSADRSMKLCGDWLLYIRILLISDIAYISLPLNTLRIHHGSTIHGYFRSNKYLMEVIRVYSFVIKQVRLSPKKKFLIVNKILLTICRRLKHFAGNYFC